MIINKFKKIIVFICLFFLSFSIVTDFKKQESQAIVFVDDALFWALGLLVLGTGVVAISNNQILDMGDMVVDRFEELGGKISDIVDEKKGIVINNLLKTAIDYVASNIPASNETRVINSDNFSYTPSFINQYNETLYKDIRVKEGFNGSSSYYFNRVATPDIVFYSDNYTFSQNGNVVVSGTSKGEIRVFSFYDLRQLAYKIVTCYYNSSLGYFVVGSVITTTKYSSNYFVRTNVSGDISITIPYSNPSIKAGYNPTYTNENLTFDEGKQGYIPIPSSVPVDIPISTEIPYTWDNVKDNINVIPVDNTGEIEIPGEDTGEGDIEAPSVWGWLLDILKSILNAIKSILSFITDFLSALLEGLKDLLLSLFVPSDTYFSDVFSDLKNRFASRLNIDSYTQLFNSDYGESTIKDITINVFGQTVTIVRFSMYEHFRSLINTLIYAFMFFLLAIYNYSQVYKLIRGSDYVGASSTITHMGGGLTQSDEIKQSNNERSIRRINGGRL